MDANILVKRVSSLLLDAGALAALVDEGEKRLGSCCRLEASWKPSGSNSWRMGRLGILFRFAHRVV